MHWESLCHCCSCPLGPAGISRQAFSNLMWAFYFSAQWKRHPIEMAHGPHTASVLHPTLFFFFVWVCNRCSRHRFIARGYVIMCCVLSCGCWRAHQGSAHTCPQQKFSEIWEPTSWSGKRGNSHLSSNGATVIPLQAVVKRLLLLIVLLVC